VSWAKRVGLAAGYAEQRGARPPWTLNLARRLVFSKVRQAIGLDRARACVCSSAPISLDTLEFFLSLGIPILEVYGMSECTGPATLSWPEEYRTGRAGKAFGGVELRISADGEVLIRGPHVFMGYYRDDEATRQAIDADGWLHSGDIGDLDAEGFLRITDRKKELIITSGGENIAPARLEAQLKTIPALASVAVVGDRRKYVAALLTLDPERLPAQAKAVGSPARTPAEASRCATFQRWLEHQVERVNRRFARFETIKRFHVLPGQFTVDGGELTPTLKLKRRVILQKYATEIDSLY
jgi:long-subunit acyl-CoA synthetase (AMP-forming)